MRNTIWAGLAFGFVVLTGPGSATANTQTLAVKVPKANFRAGPSRKHDVLFTATRYFPVHVVKKKGDWALVRDFEKEEAWISSKLLAPTHTVVVEVKKGNVRDKPSTKGEVVDKVEYGEVFRVVKRKGRWLQIATPKSTLGWVRNDLTWGER
ncbi:MAG: SH3 domain-containing protein [Myxococcota bacterium]